jgi:hypothetical protein
MAITFDITEDHGWFVGDDKDFVFEILADDGIDPWLDEEQTIPNPAKGVVNVSTWTLAWTVRKKDDSPDPPLVQKTTTSGITIEGTYNSSRASNTQRVRVSVADTDTDAVTAGNWRHALKRMTDGAEQVISRGDALLQRATTPASLS